VRGEQHLWLVAVAEVAGVTGAAVYGLWQYRRQFGWLPVSQWRLTRKLFREGVPIGLGQMFWMVRMFGAVVVVGMIATPEDVGFFGAAQRIFIALHAFIWLYFFNLLPSFAQTWQAGDGTFNRLVARSLRDVSWMSALGGSIWILASLAVMTVVYGPVFAPAGRALQWLAGAAVAAALSGHYRFGLIAAGRQNWEMAVQGLGTACALILIPIGYDLAGLDGVGAALCAAELVVWLSAWWLARQQLGLVGHQGLIARPALAALIVLVSLQLLSSLHWLGQLGAGVGAILALAWAFDPSVRARLREAYLRAQVWQRAWLSGGAKPGG
jgi:O-antigen/teichoic acid export membrane protein